MRALMFGLLVSLISTIASAQYKKPEHNCLEIGSIRVCVNKIGEDYLVTDRRDEQHAVKDCERDNQKTRGHNIVFRCKNYYDGGLVPYKGFNYFYFQHTLVGNVYHLVDAGFREKY